MKKFLFIFLILTISLSAQSPLLLLFDDDEALYPPVLDDTNTVLWVASDENVTKDGSDFVSVWGDKSGQDNDLLQAVGASQPLWSTDGILFDGTDDFMKAVAFTLEQPEQIYIVFKQITSTLFDRVFDGDANDSGVLSQQIAPPILELYAGSAIPTTNHLPLDAFGILRCLFNGSSSKLIVNDTAPITGDVGTADMGGFTLAAQGSPNRFGHIQVKEVIVRKVADSASDEQFIYDYLEAKYGL